jgi:VIT1/CCC1 family predicted Fe2+/Mn2+ transporter
MAKKKTKKKKRDKSNKKILTFVISLVSPILPILAVLIFNKIGQALPLLIACAVITVFVLWAIVSLIGTKEKSPGMKIVGTFMGSVGILVNLIFILISGWTMTKI